MARRNALVVGASAAAVGLLFLFPTSTNRSSSPRRPGQAFAHPGIVVVAASPASSARPTSPTPVDVLINGTSVDTQYGPVQVQVRVRQHRVVSAIAIDYPQGSGQDQEINRVAVPILEHEAVQAQSARIDTVSGATFTSDGYRRSLQAALDLAHL